VKALRRRDGQDGFTMVEAVISTIIVAVMLVAALSAVGASRVIQYKVSLHSCGQRLAESLLAEIARHAYEDPNGPVVFGPESGEQTTVRSDFDDVDDYHGWTETPPTEKDGSAIPQADGWQWGATVEWIDPSDPTLVQGSETGAKRITVTATHKNITHARFVTIRTAHQ
jgi:type II secretory pathway pseudopilin PulG